MRAILMFHTCEGQSHKTVSTDHNFFSGNPGGHVPASRQVGQSWRSYSGIMLSQAILENMFWHHAKSGNPGEHVLASSQVRQSWKTCSGIAQSQAILEDMFWHCTKSGNPGGHVLARGCQYYRAQLRYPSALPANGQLTSETRVFYQQMANSPVRPGCSTSKWPTHQ